MFPVPKNSTKASMIVHLVKFNKAHEHKPASFGLPSVEDLALMVQVHSLQLPRLALGDADYLRFLSDPFLQSLEHLRVESEPGAPLVACHVDLTNAFWSLRLPDHLRGAFRVCVDGKIYGFNCLPFGWQYSPIVCQTVLGYILASLGFSNVLVLHYLDDFLIVGYGKNRVRTAAASLCEALRKSGAIISVKSVLEPVTRILWLGKDLNFDPLNSSIHTTPQGWASLVGVWLRTALQPLTRKRARKVLGRFTWAVRPAVGGMPFLSGWWNFCQWGPNWLQNCPMRLLLSLTHVLVLALEGWRPPPLIPFVLARRGTIYVDAAFDKDRYKVGLWSSSLGGRVFHCSSWVRTQQEAELEAMIRGVRICEKIGWPAFCLVGDNWAALEQVASFRARSGLKRQNRHLRRLFYVWRRLQSSVYLSWAPGDLNPADCFSRIDSDWRGDFSAAHQCALDRLTALQSYTGLPAPVWILGFPKGRSGAFRNLQDSVLGAA